MINMPIKALDLTYDKVPPRRFPVFGLYALSWLTLAHLASFSVASTAFRPVGQLVGTSRTIGG